MRTRGKRPARRMKPVFIVFCEGETEELYVSMLRQKYRSPIKIIPKIAGCDISSHLIERRKREMKIDEHEKLTVFLMYDMDVEATNSKIDAINAEKLLSNPCVEFWFLLHSAIETKSLSSRRTINELKNCDAVWTNYEKATLTEQQKKYLWEQRMNAVENAKKLMDYKNPSSTIYRLLEKLEES